MNARTFLYVQVACSSLYLAFEFWFNRTLVNALAGDLSRTQITDLESTGRMLTATAVGLLFISAASWLTSIRSSHPKRISIIFVLAAFLFPATATYLFLKKVVEHASESTLDATKRRRAVQAEYLRHAGRISGIQIVGFEQGKNGGVPEKLAQVAETLALYLAPFWEDQPDILREVVRRVVVQDVGPWERLFNNCYVESFNNVVTKRFNELSDARDEHRRLLENLDESIQADWNEFVAKAGGNARYWGRDERWNAIARKRLRAKLPGIPDAWRPEDIATFALVDRDDRSSRMNEVVRKKAVINGCEIDLDTVRDFDAFLKNECVTRIWAFELEKRGELPELKNLVLTSDVAAAAQQFHKMVYEPALARLVRTAFEDLTAPVAQYEEGGRFYRVGLEAAEAVVVLWIALPLSAFGIFAHLGKLTMLGLMILRVPGIRSVIVAYLLIVMAIMAFEPSDWWQISNEVSSRTSPLSPLRLWFTRLSPLQSVLYSVPFWMGNAIGERDRSGEAASVSCEK